MEKRKEKEENVGTVALDSSLELSGIALVEEEYHGAANWGWGQEELVSCWADSKQFDIIGVCEHRRMVAPRLEGYRWMGGGAAPGRSGYGKGGAGFFVQEGFKGNIRERKEWRTPNSTWVELVGQSCIFIISIVYLPPGGTVDNFKVTLAAIEKRILDVVKEGRPLIIGGLERDGMVAWRWTGKVVGDRWQAWTDHRPLVVKLKDSADNCSRVWMERWKWKSYPEEDCKRRWREYKRGCKRFFKGEEWKAMVKKTQEGAATVEDLWSKWKKGLWDCAMRWFGRERRLIEATMSRARKPWWMAELTSLNKQVVIAHAQWLREGKNDGKAREEFVEKVCEVVESQQMGLDEVKETREHQGNAEMDQQHVEDSGKA
ncbi:hypothetical protein QOT17_001313 [Balamuthia mandrillaris]